MNNNIYTSRNDSTSGSGFENVNNFNTNNNINKSNGDDHMNNINIMDKKAWKKLSKSNTYGKYAELALKAIEAKELAEEAKADLLANRKEILKFQEELKEGDKRFAKYEEQLQKADEELQKADEELQKADEELQKADEELQQAKEELQKAKEELQKADEERDHYKEERDHYKAKSEELELENAKGIGKSDASLKINEEIQAELQRQAESITADYEVYDDCSDELAVKSGMINQFRANIKANKKAIATAKHDIKMGVAVNRNKKWIRDLEAQNRYLQNQINGFQSTFNEFKTQKTMVSETIDTKRNNYEELENAWTIVSGVLNK